MAEGEHVFVEEIKLLLTSFETEKKVPLTNERFTKPFPVLLFGQSLLKCLLVKEEYFVLILIHIRHNFPLKLKSRNYTTLLLV